jgi:hypothetical protein
MMMGSFEFGRPSGSRRNSGLCLKRRSFRLVQAAWELGFLMLFEIIPVEVSVSLEPVLSGVDRAPG